MMQAFLVGTSHPYQISRECPAKTEYQSLLQDVCARNRISIIAEEMSREGLKGSYSLAERVAQAAGLQYHACDPDSAKRDKLGIQNEGLVRAVGLKNGWGQRRINDVICAEHRKREEYWLEQLQELDAWPVLFVCGADHVESFSNLLSRNRIAPVILDYDWAP